MIWLSDGDPGTTFDDVWLSVAVALNIVAVVILCCVLIWRDKVTFDDVTGGAFVALVAPWLWPLLPILIPVGLRRIVQKLKHSSRRNLRLEKKRSRDRLKSLEARSEALERECEEKQAELDRLLADV